MATALPTIEASWQVIENVLGEVLPDVAKTLRPGATAGDIARLEKAIGFSLPEDFRTSLMRHDGQDDPSGTVGLFNFNRLLSVDQILADYAMLRGLFGDEGPIEWLVPDKIQNRVWAPGWVKFTECEGDGLVLDLSPTAEGKVGQIFYRPHDDNSIETQADSFRAFLARVATLMREGEYEIEEGGMVFDEGW